MLTGIMWQYNWGSRRELVNVYYYLKGTYSLTGVVYGREWMFGLVEEKTIPPQTWLFETEEG